ncbi:MAG: hypothetical protein KBS35_01955 [Mycoplasma sp.]|nr:hypothetical protein [Candidatus Hennigella equi]
MKKTTILLPLATIGSVAAIATPLMTSCNGGSFHLEHEHDGSKPFVPETQRKSGTAYALDATVDYLTDVKNNKKIMAEDLIYRFDDAVRPGETLKKLTVNINNINPKERKCSFDIQLDIDVQIGETEDKYELSIKYEVKNLGFLLQYDDADTVKKWIFAPAAYMLYADLEDFGREANMVRYLQAHHDWSATVTQITPWDEAAFTWNSKSDWADLYEAMNYVFNDILRYSPYYFQNVAPVTK